MSYLVETYVHGTKVDAFESPSASVIVAPEVNSVSHSVIETETANGTKIFSLFRREGATVEHKGIVIVCKPVTTDEN